MSNINIKISKKIFNDVYLEHLEDYEKRFEIYYGGAGSGKSVFITQKILYKALKYNDRKFLIIRKVGNTLRDSVFALMKRTLSEWGLYDICKINKTDLTIELENGSIFLFKSFDDPEKIKSIEGITDIWVEETTEIDEFDFDQLSLRLRSKKPYNQFFCSFNPISKSNWVYKRWFSDTSKIEDNTMILKTTYLDNRFLPSSYIENLMSMKKNNLAYYNIYALGDFATLDKLVYTNWEVKEFDYLELLKTKKMYAVFGLDWGYTNDKTAIISSLIDEANKEIYIYWEYGARYMTNADIYKVLEENCLTKERIVCDSSEPKSLEELKRLGCFRVVGANKGHDSILNGIQVIQQYKIYVHPSCTQTREELKNYTWIKDKSTNEYINKPIDKYNHFMDALRYSITDRVGKKSKKMLISYM